MNPRDAQLRQQLAREAARVMIEGGIQDFALAKRKALERLRLPASSPLPRNTEIEDARHEYQRLFGGEDRARRVADLRAAAVEAMRELAPFRPRLTGPLLSDAADGHSVVCLHLFADSAEDVGWFLMERGIPHRNSEQRHAPSRGYPHRVSRSRFIPRRRRPGRAGGVQRAKPAARTVVAGGRARDAPRRPRRGGGAAGRGRTLHGGVTGRAGAARHAR